MQGGKLLAAQNRFLRHEMPAEQIFVLDDCALERFQDYASSEQFLGERVAPEQLVVGKDQAAGDLSETGGTLENLVAPGLGERRPEVVAGKIERRDIRKAPGLVLPIRIRQRLEFRPGRLLLLAKPRRQIR